MSGEPPVAAWRTLIDRSPDHVVKFRLLKLVLERMFATAAQVQRLEARVAELEAAVKERANG